MKKNYYFKSIEVKKSPSVVKIYPISGQTDISGNPINEKIPVARCLKEKLIPGKIFISSGIKLQKSGKIYSTSKLRLINECSVEEVDGYNSLVTDDMKIVVKSAPVEKTLFDIITSSPEMKSPSSEKDGFFMTDENWKLLVRNIKRQVNTMIIGPTGTGKTSCVREVCNRLEIELHVFDMGSMIDPISSLLGVHRLEKGKSIFDFAKFTQVIQKPCVILLDELNRASLGSNNILFPCLDDRRELSIEIAGSKDVRTIKVHPEVTFIATANIGSEYTGTTNMDKALINRFFPLELGYIPKEEEVKVLMKRCGLEKDKAEMIVKIANNIRSLYQKSEISSSVSIRESLMIGNLIKDGWDLGKAVEMVYIPLFEGNNVNEGEKSIVYKTILSY